MKLVMIIPDGAADEPVAALAGRTPLEAADTPNMDAIARAGRIGRVVTIPPGMAAGTDVGSMSLFGYDPVTCHTGRAPIEALARGLSPGPDELIFRCNFVTILDGRMRDFTAGHIEQDEADWLIRDLNNHFGDEAVIFHPGVSYRNLMTMRGAGDFQCSFMPPHEIPDAPVADHGPKGPGADRISELLRRGAEVLRDHPVNAARRSAGKAPVTDIWLWGHGRSPSTETLRQRYGLRVAVITAVDIIRGLGIMAGADLIEVEGATGFIDTNYAGKGEAAVKALNDYDLTFVHVEAPDEAGHLGDAAMKTEAIEQVDKHVVGPVLAALRSRNDWRLMVAPDHPTPINTRAHSSVPPPFCYCGSDVEPNGADRFDENAAAQGPLIDPGHQLLAMFLGKQAP